VEQAMPMGLRRERNKLWLSESHERAAVGLDGKQHEKRCHRLVQLDRAVLVTADLA
jgi:hypothetical protein